MALDDGTVLQDPAFAGADLLVARAEVLQTRSSDTQLTVLEPADGSHWASDGAETIDASPTNVKPEGNMNSNMIQEDAP